jgi:hypothetical protein
MGVHRYIRVLREDKEIELQSTDELAFARLVTALSQSALKVRVAKSPYSYFHHCRFRGANEHVDRAWKLIADRLHADGWVRLDDSSATGSDMGRLMYFGVPPRGRRKSRLSRR